MRKQSMPFPKLKADNIAHSKEMAKLALVFIGRKLNAAIEKNNVQNFGIPPVRKKIPL
jgi:hypothetical protein